LLVIAF